MQKFNGNLSIMPVADIIQWADNNKRTGTLVLVRDGRQKKFFIQDGDIIYIWSNCEEDHCSYFLEDHSLISQDKLSKAYADSEALGLPFISYLLAEGIFSKELLEDILRNAAELVLTSALEWDTGKFEFVEGLPKYLLDSPVRVCSFQVLLEATRHFDESKRSNHVNPGIVMDEIREQIRQGNFELPPIPDVMQQMAEKINDPNISIDEIIACITDQILVSKILKICNSPYYGRLGHVSSLKDAVVFIGLKSMMSIVTVHAMSGFSPRNEVEIKKVLQHSLVCGMIARQITRDLRGNFELAFISGLLHDIGKTILLEMLYDYTLQPDERERLIQENHAEVGYLLAEKWNFGDDIKTVIRFHHTPELAGEYVKLAEVISLANAMAMLNTQPQELSAMTFTRLELSQINVDDMMGQVDMLDCEASGIVSLV